MVRSFESQGRCFTSAGRCIDPSPSTVTIVDSFEDQDMSEYTGVDLSDISFVTSPVFDGTYALEHTGFDNIGSQSGLNAYPSKGDIFNYVIRQANTTGLVRLHFGRSDANNFYEVDTFDGNLELNVSSAGSRSTLGSTTVATSGDTWYQVRVTWDDGTLGGSDNEISVELIEDPAGTNTSVASIGPFTDSTHATETGIGLIPFSATATDPQYFDYFHIE